ncbi:MAG: glycosyltransferase [Candidatus Zixiibacteriota bacterium]
MAGRRVVIFGWAQSVHVQRWVQGLKQRGFEIKLVSLGGKPLAGIDNKNFPYGGKWRYPLHALQAARAATAFKPDLVHVHYAGGFGLWGLVTRFHPTLVSVWGADIMESAAPPIMRGLVRRVLSHAIWVTATSHFLADICSTLAPVTKNKLSVIPFGVAIPPICSPLPAGDTIGICFLKAHRAKYGPDLLIRALAISARSVPNVSLSLAGQGEMTDDLKKLAQTCGLGEHIRFTGFIPPEKVYEFITRHHFMVMPSVSESESFGVAALEAGACGRAVIASRIGGVPEVVRDGYTGLLVSPGNVTQLAEAITRLACDHGLMDRFGRTAYEHVKQQYDWEKSLDAMAGLYERLIDETKKNPTV